MPRFGTNGFRTMDWFCTIKISLLHSWQRTSDNMFTFNPNSLCIAFLSLKTTLHDLFDIVRRPQTYGILCCISNCSNAELQSKSRLSVLFSMLLLFPAKQDYIRYVEIQVNLSTIHAFCSSTYRQLTRCTIGLFFFESHFQLLISTINLGFDRLRNL